MPTKSETAENGMTRALGKVSKSIYHKAYEETWAMDKTRQENQESIEKPATDGRKRIAADKCTRSDKVILPIGNDQLSFFTLIESY